VEATADGTRVVLTLPTDADVEGFVDSLERRYDQVRLRSRRERTRPVAREQHVWAKLEESLTDRQLETLRTAYLSGYFEWPRESTGEEVAQRWTSRNRRSVATSGLPSASFAVAAIRRRTVLRGSSASDGSMLRSRSLLVRTV